MLSSLLNMLSIFRPCGCLYQVDDRRNKKKSSFYIQITFPIRLHATRNSDEARGIVFHIQRGTVISFETVGPLDGCYGREIFHASSVWDEFRADVLYYPASRFHQLTNTRFHYFTLKKQLCSYISYVSNMRANVDFNRKPYLCMKCQAVIAMIHCCVTTWSMLSFWNKTIYIYI